MSNLIPPLLSSSPPPIVGPLDEEDDEFGDFRAATDSYDCDDLSLPASPQKSPDKEPKHIPDNNLDINCNKSQKSEEMPTQNLDQSISDEVVKDFCDRRKSDEVTNGDVDEFCNFSCNEPAVDKIGTEVEPADQTNDTQSESELVTFPNGSIQHSSDESSAENVQEKANSDSETDVKLEEKSESVNLSELSTSFKTEANEKNSDDEFGDFENHFESNDDFHSQSPNGEEDDFGDFESPEFTDFSCHVDEKPSFLEFNEQNAADKSKQILIEIFPAFSEQDNVIDIKCKIQDDAVFDKIKDITETSALMYQWSKSSSQKMFFKALNIDTRNILYGPSWNPSMPIFAANLGPAPLEPIKTEILQPTPLQQVSSNPSSSSQKNSSDIPTAQFDWTGSGLINPLDSTSTELPGKVPEDAPANQPNFLPLEKQVTASLFTDDLPKPATDDAFHKPVSSQFDDFSPADSPKLIPLRETHIYNDQNDVNKPGWLKPTILTPDLPRKEPVIEPEEDDFDDFQMSLPVEAKSVEKKEHISSGPKDEFTDFQSVVENDILKPVPAEPLKPTVQYKAPTQINWPEPGVTDEDIKNIELVYSRKNESNDSQKDEQKPSKQSSFEEDEWSDFVSVTSPIKSRTATPDLPLSVLNLNSVQAPKQPIPVITPSGLVQTRLSSNLNSVVQTKVQAGLFRPPMQQFQQPSIISTQYAANFPSSSAQKQNQDDDEEDWSEFVSGPPTQQTNGCRQWNNVPTNIIMNPTHFESLSYTAAQNKNIASISAIPDLDFIAPKSRTSKK